MIEGLDAATGGAEQKRRRPSRSTTVPALGFVPKLGADETFAGKIKSGKREKGTDGAGLEVLWDWID